MSARQGGKAEPVKPGPLGEVVHGTGVGEVIGFVFLHIAMGGGRWETTVLALGLASLSSAW